MELGTLEPHSGTLKSTGARIAFVRCAGAVSHETRQFIHLKVDTLNIILWKSKVRGP